eukprot:m51a1_g12204 putative niemann-pick c1 protein (447) ;mRNA; f:319-1992
MREVYAPNLLRPPVKAAVMLGGLALFFACATNAFSISAGLTPSLVLPRDSYLRSYLRQASLMPVGPMFQQYFLEGIDYSDPEVQNHICTNPGCNADSVANLLIAAPTVEPDSNVWLDDYLEWAQSKGCCWHVAGDPLAPCPRDGSARCERCFGESERPQGERFYRYLPWFLRSRAGSNCSVSGVAYQSDIVMANATWVATSRVAFYHAPLRTQEDYVDAVMTAYKVADVPQLSAAGAVAVSSAAYSSAYPLYEQYVHIRAVTIVGAGAVFAVVFAMAVVLLGNFFTALIACACVAGTLVGTVGTVAVWGESLNAISCANVISSVGVAAGFVFYVAHTFQRAPRASSDRRATTALVESGSTVLIGVAATKLLGVAALAASGSELFGVYYLRYYVAFVAMAALHGLVVLPVWLAVLPPSTYDLSLPWCAEERDSTSSFAAASPALVLS